MTPTTVNSIMSFPVAVLTSGMKLSVARRILSDSHFHHLPVVDDAQRVVGVVSTTDMLKLSCEAYGVDGEVMDAVIDRQFTLEEVMRPPVVVNKSASVKEAACLLSTGEIHSLPVVDDVGRLHGILTSTDLIDFLVGQLAA